MTKQAVIIKCPFCGGDALANYKSSKFLGKCVSVECHKMFQISAECFASKQKWEAYLLKATHSNANRDSELQALRTSTEQHRKLIRAMEGGLE